MGYKWLHWVTPNQLTIGRMLTVPVLMVLLYLDAPVTNLIALVIFILAGVTDYVDGNLARFRDEVSDLGRLLDPIADKMVVTAALVMLVAAGHAGAVATTLILLREFAVSGLRQVAALDGIAIEAVRGAKWKTVLQMLATGMLMVSVNPLDIAVEPVGRVMLWIAVVATLWTGYGYFQAYFRNRRA